MHHCPDCLREVADLVKHRSEYHSLPSPVIINGEPMTVLRRDGRLICPVPQCGAAYKTRTSFKKHVDTNHATSDSLLLANGASATSSKRPAPEGSPEATKLPKRRKLLLRSLRDAFQRAVSPLPRRASQSSINSSSSQSLQTSPTPATVDGERIPPRSHSDKRHRNESISRSPIPFNLPTDTGPQTDSMAVEAFAVQHGGPPDVGQATSNASQINPPIADNGYDHVGSDKSPDVNPGALVDRIRLDGKQNYLLSYDVLQAIGVVYHRALRVIICLQCKACFIPNDMPGHLRNDHAVSVPLGDFRAACASLAVHPDYSAVLHPYPRGPPVQHIRQTTGFACAADPEKCGFCCRSKEWMVRHVTTLHPKQVHRMSERYRSSVQLQTLFPNLGVKYFEVEPALAGVNSNAVLGRILQQFVPGLKPLPAQAPSTEREVNHLLRVVRWHEKMEPWYTVPAKLATIKALKSPYPAGDEDGQRIKLACKAYVDLATGMGRTCSPNLTIRKHLAQGRHLSQISPARQRDEYWTPLPDNESPATYALALEAFIRITLRSLENHPSQFRIPLSPEQEQGARFLAEAARDHSRDLIPHVHDFLYPLLVARPTEPDPIMWSCPVTTFFAVWGQREDGRFMSADQFTRVLAQWKYIIHSAGIIQANRTHKSHEQGMIGAVIDAHEEILTLGSNCPYNIIYEYQQFASSLVYNETRPPRLYWSPDMENVSIGGETLAMSEFRTGIAKLIQRINVLLLKLTGGRSFATNVPANMKDDLPNDERGYSWLDHGPFTETTHAFLEYLVSESGWDIAVIDGEGNLAWNIPALHEILKLCAQLNECLMICHHIVPSQPHRGTEFVDMKIRNEHRPRNLHAILQDMFWLLRYHKSGNITERDVCIPSFIPPALITPTIEYLAGGIREVEEIFAGIIYGADAAALYHTYAWVQMGRRVTSEQLSVALSRHTQTLMGASLTLSSYRHVAVAIAREYIPPQFHLHGGDNAIDLALAHSTNQARGRYGLVEGDLPYLTQDSIWEFRSVCEQWWAVCGLGDGPPPSPLRIVPKATCARPPAASPSHDEAVEVINNIVTATVSDAFNDLKMGLKEFLPEMIRSGIRAVISTSSINKTLQTRSSPQSSPTTLAENSQACLSLASGGHKAISISSASNSIISISSDEGVRNVSDDDFDIPALVLDSNSDDLCYDGGEDGRADVYEESGEWGEDEAWDEEEDEDEAWEDDDGGWEEDDDEGWEEDDDEGWEEDDDDDDDDDDDENDDENDDEEDEGSDEDFGNDKYGGDGDDDDSDGGHSHTRHHENDHRDDRGRDDDHRRTGGWEEGRGKKHFQGKFDDSGSAKESNSEQSSSPAPPFDYTLLAFRGLRKVLACPDAKPSSPEQLEAIKSALSLKQDTVVILPCGGGKSMAWLAPATVQENVISAVIVPFCALLTQHLENAISAGIRATRYQSGSNPPNDVQIIFLQPESARSNGFKTLLGTPLGARIKRIYFDEAQEYLIPHPDRISIYTALSDIISRLNIQRLFLSATLPPSLHPIFCKHALLDKQSTLIIRASTDRPEIAHHAIPINRAKMHITSLEATARLATALKGIMTAQQQGMVIVKSIDVADRLSADLKCAVHHSALPKHGNTAARNLHLWNSGESPFIVTTTGLSQGIDRQFVRFIIFHDGAFGQIAYVQGAGRAGRAGLPSHAFIVFNDSHYPVVSKKVKDVGLIEKHFQFKHNVTFCRRLLLTEAMDGRKLSKSCRTADPACNSCDVCHPDSEMVLFAKVAIAKPAQSHTARVRTETPGAINSIVESSRPLLPKEALILGSTERPPGEAEELASASDDEFAFGSSQIEFTPSVLNALDGMEKGFQKSGPVVDDRLSGTPFSSSPFTLSMAHAMDDAVSTFYGQPNINASTYTNMRPISASQPTVYHSSRDFYSEGAGAGPLTSPPTLVVGDQVRARVQRTNDWKQKRLNKSATLDHFMTTFGGKCPVCLVTGSHLVPAHALFDDCSSAAAIPRQGWLAFKRNFVFEKYSYCYSCGMPQDRNFNGESPACHRTVPWGKGSFCPWSDFICLVLWSTWYSQDIRAEALQSFQLPEDLSFVNFCDWVNAEDKQSGCYYNGLEVFLWFCERWEKNGRRVGA